MELSVVYPMFNEAGNVRELVSRTVRVLRALYPDPHDFEIVCVDDHSSDETLEQLRRAASQHEKVHVVSLDVHLGHAGAIEVGFRFITGRPRETWSRATLLCNADLQYRPEEIPNFLRAMQGNSRTRIVNGWRVQKVDPLVKNIASRVYNALSRHLFHTTLHDHASNFALYSTPLLAGLHLSGNDQRYIIATLKYKHGLSNAQIQEIPVSHHPRQYGRSKYPAWRKILFGGLEILRKKRALERKYPQANLGEKT